MCLKSFIYLFSILLVRDCILISCFCQTLKFQYFISYMDYGCVQIVQYRGHKTYPLNSKKKSNRKRDHRA